MKTVVTGGAGFIGSHLCDTLVDRGCEVVCFDNFSVGMGDNVTHLRNRENFVLANGDIMDKRNLDSVFQGANIVFHLAAKVGVKRYVEDPVGVLATNFYGTHNVLDACLKTGVQKLVFGSTSEVYGKNPKMPLVEDSDRVLGPATIDRWSYSVSKSAGEHLCNAYFKMHGLSCVILRYFNIYGPRAGESDYAGVVSVFIRSILRGQAPLVHGSGQQARCFTYVRDAVGATTRAAEVPEAAGESINVGSSVETTILELAKMIIKLSGNESLHPKMVPHKQAYGLSYEDIGRRVPSTVKLEKILGFTASTSLPHGLRKTIEWFRSTSNSPRLEENPDLTFPL